ncbi:MAG: (E)-4-hydroxy-3-methylbut-2-enyl-diphosphate synthase [Bacteroidetes bacterium]|nr:(E)-4-hydroxy-3-methylbut-2-enyl-diphosphate synthase [Bacteroidota bacterium]
MQENNSNRLQTITVSVGQMAIGFGHPIRIQTMTTTDTLDTAATVAQTIRCIEAGAELVRITAPSKNEAENLGVIKASLRQQGYDTPLVADIHFTPNAAEIAARLIEKVRVNPGNYVDKKKFAQIDYTDQEYHAEIDRIRDRFLPLVLICKEEGTAMRIGTNHGSLSDRIMSRYGDTALGMVESAMEFLRIARSVDYHQIVLSMKSSNPIVMVEAYRLLVQHMGEEFGAYYPLHLGVTEAGDGLDGRVKSSIGIGSLLIDGIGDTIRVSLTEDPEFELPVCSAIIKAAEFLRTSQKPSAFPNSFNGYSKAHATKPVGNIGGGRVPVVVADYSASKSIQPKDLEAIGYRYHSDLDKWSISDAAADYIFLGNQEINFPLPGTLSVILEYDTWLQQPERNHTFPKIDAATFLTATNVSPVLNFVLLDLADADALELAKQLVGFFNIVLCLQATKGSVVAAFRSFFDYAESIQSSLPIIFQAAAETASEDELIALLSIQTGALFMEAKGQGIWLKSSPVCNQANAKFLNDLAFSILQATRVRISKTEYISCPSCGRTLFDLQETTAKIRAATGHLKGLKIAVMGCIVNGPGEMADADFGYVGSGPGKITLYQSKEVVKRNIPSEIAVGELIQLLKDAGVWIDAPSLAE